MAANANAGRAGGGGANNNNNNPMNNEHVEFSVKAEEDLYLTGNVNTIRRVTAETNYSCLMLKTQRFSSLFRHYAKYHGLRKDDLEYYFVNLLENEDTPESVQLQRGDTIMVRKRQKAEPPEVAADDDDFITDMRELLEDEEHMDAVFVVTTAPPPAEDRSFSQTAAFTQRKGGGTFTEVTENKTKTKLMMKNNDTFAAANAMDTLVEAEDSNDNDNNTSNDEDGDAARNKGRSNNNNIRTIEIRAHKSILTARAEYFKALFRKAAATTSASTTTTQKTKNSNASTAFKESVECVVTVDPVFTELQIRAVLEFIYTNRIADLRQHYTTDDLLAILHLSDQWLLRDLKRLIEHELIRHHLTVVTVARLYGATEDYNARRLSKACIEFIMANLRQLAGNPAFAEEMKQFPHLCIPVLQAAADLLPDHLPLQHPLHKKQKTGEHNHSTPTATAAFRSSPVPDSDA